MLKSLESWESNSQLGHQCCDWFRHQPKAMCGSLLGPNSKDPIIKMVRVGREGKGEGEGE